MSFFPTKLQRTLRRGLCKKKQKKNKQQENPCQLVSDLEVVGGLLTNKRPSPPSYKPELPLITNLLQNIVDQRHLPHFTSMTLFFIGFFIILC
jgi:hypothetical protein